MATSDLSIAISARNLATAEFQRLIADLNRAQLQGNLTAQQMAALGAAVARAGSSSASLNDLVRRLQATQTASAAAAGPQGIGGMATAMAIGQVAAQAFMGALQALTGAVVEQVQAAFQYNSAIQSNEVAYESLMGSAEAAHAQVAKLVEFANTTPFSTKQVTEFGQKMLVAGQSAESIIPSLEAIGNVAVVSGKNLAEVMPRISLALSQVAAAGRLQGDELNQLTDAGIPALQAISNAYGISAGEVTRLKEQGKISFDVLMYSIKQMGLESERFAGGMGNSMKSAAGAMDMLKTNAEAARARALKPLTDAMGELIVKAAEFTQTDEFATRIADAERAITVMVTTIKEGALPALKDLGDAFALALKGVGQEGEGGSPDQFLKNVAVAIDALTRIFLTQIKLMIENFGVLVDVIASGSRLIVDTLGGLLDFWGKVLNGERDAAQSMRASVNQMGKDLSDFGTGVRKGVLITNEAIHSIPDSFNAARAEVDAIMARPPVVPKVPTAPNKPGAPPDLGGVKPEDLAKALARSQEALADYYKKWGRAAEDRATENRKLLDDYARETAEVHDKLAAQVVEIDQRAAEKVNSILDQMVEERAKADAETAQVHADLVVKLDEIDRAHAEKLKVLVENEAKAAKASADERAQIARDLNDTLVALAEDAHHKVVELDEQAIAQRAATNAAMEQVARDLADAVLQVQVDAANRYAEIEQRRVDAAAAAAARIADVEQTFADRRDEIERGLADRKLEIALNLADQLASVEESTQAKLAGIKERYGPDAKRATRRGMTAEQRGQLSELSGEFGTDVGALQNAASGFTGARAAAAAVLIKELIADRERETKAAIEEGEKQTKAAVDNADKQTKKSEETADKAIKAAVDVRDKAIQATNDALDEKLKALDKERLQVDTNTANEIAQANTAAFLKISKIQEVDRESQLKYENERSRIDLEFNHAVAVARDRAREQTLKVDEVELARKTAHDNEMTRINDEQTEASSKATTAATDKLFEIKRVYDDQVTKHGEAMTRIRDEAEEEKTKATDAATAHIFEIGRTAQAAVTAFNTRKQRAYEDQVAEYNGVMALISAYDALNARSASRAPGGPTPLPFPDMTTNNVPVFDNGGVLREPVVGRGLRSGLPYGFAMSGPESFGGVGRTYDGQARGEIDYNKLAAALSEQPITIVLDGQALGSANRRLNSLHALRNQKGDIVG